MTKKGLQLVFAGLLSFMMVDMSDAAKKKVLFIDSYHAGYEWSDGVTSGILGTFNVKVHDDGSFDTSASDVDVKIFRMDTKHNISEAFKQKAALQAKAEIDAWQPDLLIASDDNASKYLIAPYFKDTELPVVFCGVNWDASAYGFPSDNVTGMLEVALVTQLLHSLKPYMSGERIGLLASDELTTRKDADHILKSFDLKTATRFVTSFNEWKQTFLELQQETDAILLYGTPMAVFPDWHADEAAAFIEAHATIPLGAFYAWMAPFALISYVAIPEEQGEWAAKTALKILEGTSPNDIPIATNAKGKIYLNMSLAKKLGIKFPYKLVKRATLIK